MGLLKTLGIDNRIEIPKQGNKFIHAYIEFVGLNDKTKADAQKIAEDVSTLIYNTESLFSKDNKFLGCINPYLGINTIMTTEGLGKESIQKISKVFMANITKEKGAWKLTFNPTTEKGKIDLYSLPRFHQDGFGIVQSCDWIAKRYNIELGQLTIHKIKLIGEQPVLESIEGILHTEYFVQERIENYNIMPELDELIFGEDIMTTIKDIQKQSKKRNKLLPLEKEWFAKIKKMVDSF